MADEIEIHIPVIDSLDGFIDWLEDQKRDALRIVGEETDLKRIDAAHEAMTELNQAMWLVTHYLAQIAGYGAQPHAERLEGYPTGQAT